jgi:hypothetical protein
VGNHAALLHASPAWGMRAPYRGCVGGEPPCFAACKPSMGDEGGVQGLRVGRELGCLLCASMRRDEGGVQGRWGATLLCCMQAQRGR